MKQRNFGNNNNTAPQKKIFFLFRWTRLLILYVFAVTEYEFGVRLTLSGHDQGHFKVEIRKTTKTRATMISIRFWSR